MMRLFSWKKNANGTVAANRDETDLAVAETSLELNNVGPYEIIAPIGTGGLGTVYKAIDRLRDQTVASKVLARQFDFDQEKGKRH